MRRSKSNRRRPYEGPRGVRACWRTWRHCMCTTGWYPVLIAPVITAGFLLSLYSSSGCEFIDVSVGFTPSNAAWNQSHADLGLFYYHEPALPPKSNKYEEKFHGGCVWYTDIFQETVVEKDRTWKVARVMAMIAVSGSLLAALTIWLIVFVPVPVSCIWPGVLLPASMLSFIAEGSKFLIFDIALCRNAVWFPSGVDSLPAEAENCSMGPSAFVGIAAGAVHLIALLSICLKSPEKRELDPNFGLQYDSNSEQDFIEATTDRDYRRDSNLDDDDDDEDAEDTTEDPSILDDDIYTSGPSPTSTQQKSESSSRGSSSAAALTPRKPAATDTKLDSSEASSPSPHVSESRLSAMVKMQLSSSASSQELIEDLVSELDTSLNDGDQKQKAR